MQRVTNHYALAGQKGIVLNKTSIGDQTKLSNGNLANISYFFFERRTQVIHVNRDGKNASLQ